MADILKAKVKTARMAMDITGKLDDAIVDVFGMIGTSARREDVLAKLQIRHADMIAWDAEKARGDNG